MKIALVGTTGHVGHYFLNEALQRGHTITTLARSPSKLAARDGLYVVQADVSDPAQMANAVTSHEVIISAFNGGWGSADLYARRAAGSQAILDDVKRSGMPRPLVLGSAGNLEIAPGQRLVDSLESPEQWRQGTLGTANTLDQLHGERQLDWMFLSPAMLLGPGRHNDKFRFGSDQVLFNAKGESRISLEDLAVIMLDEAEQLRHHRQYFTVAY